MWQPASSGLLRSFVALSVAMLLWNVLITRQIASARHQPRVHVVLASLCGLLVIPGAVISMLSTTRAGSAMAGLAWIWPVALAVFVAQSAVALRSRRVSSLVGVPLFAYNTLLFLAALGRSLTPVWPDVPAWLLGFGVAQGSTLGLLWGDAALFGAWCLPMPLLSPLAVPRWRVTRGLLGTLSVGASVFAALVLLSWPPGVRAVTSWNDLGGEVMQQRTSGPLALGLRVLPDVQGWSTAGVALRDLGVADSLGATMLAVVVTPSGSSRASLDSLASLLAPWRGDSVPLLVSLGYDRGDRQRMDADDGGYVQARLASVDRITRILRPQYLAPALDPGSEGTRWLGAQPPGWWQDVVTRSARGAHATRPGTRIVVSASTFTPDDSTLYAWAASSPDVDAVGFSFTAGWRGGAAVQARQRAAQRWMRRNTRPHLVTAVRTWPYLFGERGQRHALLGTHAWASRQPRISAVVVDQASDHDIPNGLLRANGSARPSLTALARARQALADAR